MNSKLAFLEIWLPEGPPVISVCGTAVPAIVQVRDAGLASVLPA